MKWRTKPQHLLPHKPVYDDSWSQNAHCLNDNQPWPCDYVRTELARVNREHLQRAYNGICGVLGDLRYHTTNRADLVEQAEELRAEIALIAFPKEED